MQTILRYLMNMLPYMLMILPVYAVIRWVMLRHRKIRWRHEAAPEGSI